MSAKRRLDHMASRAGIVGAFVIVVGSLITAIAYRGAGGASYSPLSHFVSELGELAQSELAGVFNVSLIVGGVCFAVFMLGLAAGRPGLLRLLGGAVGLVAGLGGAFVGVFPTDFGVLHGLAATAFFNFGWIAIALASVDFVVRRDRRFPRGLAVLGFVAVVAFIAFLREVGVNTSAGLLIVPEVRPDVWALPTLEWLTIVGIVGWVLSVSVSWLWAGEPSSVEVGVGDHAGATVA